MQQIYITISIFRENAYQENIQVNSKDGEIFFEVELMKKIRLDEGICLDTFSIFNGYFYAIWTDVEHGCLENVGGVTMLFLQMIAKKAWLHACLAEYGDLTTRS